MAKKATIRFTVIATMKFRAGQAAEKINVKKGSDPKLLDAIKVFFETNPDVERIVARKKTENTENGQH